MLNTSLQEQGDNEDMRAKIFEVENLLEAEVVEQQENDEVTKAVEAAINTSKTSTIAIKFSTNEKPRSFALCKRSSAAILRCWVCRVLLLWLQTNNQAKGLVDLCGQPTNDFYRYPPDVLK